MSHAQHLFDLVLTLKQLARQHEVFIHCFHISGDRMIASGVDGLSPLDQFEVKMPHDFNVATLTKIEDEICFKQARPGDHLYTPFQCSNCQSYNISCKVIHQHLVEDLMFECMVVRATLDALWSRATKTIGNHVLEV